MSKQKPATKSPEGSAGKTGALPNDSSASLKEELGKMPAKPLLPVEKKLIVISLLLGIVLLVLLAWISFTFFPV